MKNIDRILWGIVLIIVGLVWGLNKIGMTSINIFFSGWWTLFIIIPSFISLFDSNNDNETLSLIGLLIGILFLLDAQNVIDISKISGLIMPAVVVLIGVSLLFNPKDKKSLTNTKNINVLFSSQNIIKNKDDEASTTLNATFSNVTLDIKKAQIEEDTVIKITNVFGSVRINIPANVDVKLIGTPIFGTIKNKNTSDKATQTILIEATSIFGKVEIV